MKTKPALQVSHLSKFFGSKKVLSDIDLTLYPGDIYALVGPNGSGKTTLVKNIVGLLTPEAGSVTLNGFDIARDPLAAKTQFGYVPDGPGGFEFLTGREFLYFAATLKRLSQKQRAVELKKLLPLFPLAEVLDLPMQTYSRGNLQKVAFLASLLGRPPLLIIDEPVVGLDPASTETFGRILKDYAKAGHTVFFVTHILSFAQSYAHRFGLLDLGRLVHEGRITSRPTLASYYRQRFHHA